jgi:hypothetical protein
MVGKPLEIKLTLVILLLIQRAEIGTSGKNVFVTWWETMDGKDVPMLRVRTDNGKTFGPLLNLSTNGTIGTGAGG